MIVHVCHRAVESGAEQIVVATDDERILKTVGNAGYQAVMTRSDHATGTDRIAEVVEQLDWLDETMVVNIQGDEPLIDVNSIRTLVSTLEMQSKADVATVSTNIVDADELSDPNIVKVVTDQAGYALYFSRATIPWDRDGIADTATEFSTLHQRHLGLYAYRVKFLKRFVKLSVSPIELLEKLEQLRILWNAEPMVVASVSSLPSPGVDTPQDLSRVEQIMLNRQRAGSTA